MSWFPWRGERAIVLDLLCGSLCRRTSSLSWLQPSEHTSQRTTVTVISASQRDVGVDEIKVVMKFLHVLLVFWYIHWLFEFTILYFISSVWVQGYNNYAFLISINKLTWPLLNGENSIHSVFPPNTWKTVGLAFTGYLVIIPPPPLFLFTTLSSLLLFLPSSIRSKFQILMVVFHHGIITLFGITEN